MSGFRYMNLGGKGLGADEEEGRLGIDQLQRFGHVRPIHVAATREFIITLLLF